MAEGRARSAAVRAYKAAHPEEEAARLPAAAGTAAATAPRRGRRRPPRPAAAMVAAPASAPTRSAPLTGNIPTPKKGAPDKHRLLALVPEGIQRVEREQGDRVNVWPHLLIEEFVRDVRALRRASSCSRRS